MAKPQEEAVYRCGMHVESVGHILHRCSGQICRLDVALIATQLVLFIVAPWYASKLGTFGFLPGQRLLRPLTDEISFNLGRQTECKCQDLALDVFAKTVVILDSPDSALFRHADVENLHNHKQIASQARQFGANNEVIPMDAVQQLPKFPLIVILCPADCLLNPPLNGHSVPVAEVVDFEPLVLDSLFVAADSDVTVNHNRIHYIVFQII